MIGLRNDHDYGEPHEFKRLRHRDQADERHAVDSRDLPDDRAREYEPVPWWAIDPSFHNLRPPESLVMVGSRSNPVTPSACLDQAGATDASAAGVTPPAGGAPPSRKAA